MHCSWRSCEALHSLDYAASNSFTYTSLTGSIDRGQGVLRGARLSLRIPYNPLVVDVFSAARSTWFDGYITCTAFYSFFIDLESFGRIVDADDTEVGRLSN